MTSTDDDAKLAGYAADLCDGIAAHLTSWVEGVVRARVPNDRVGPAMASLHGEVERVVRDVDALLATDIDGQRANPLGIVRSLVPALTDALRIEGVVPVRRDPDAERIFPEDAYDLTPSTFGDIHPDLHLAGLAWGAAKAHVHLQRRRAEGMR